MKIREIGKAKYLTLAVVIVGLPMFSGRLMMAYMAFLFDLMAIVIASDYQRRLTSQIRKRSGDGMSIDEGRSN